MTAAERIAFYDQQIALFQKMKEDELAGDTWLIAREARKVTGWSDGKLRWLADRNQLITRRTSGGYREYLRSSLLERLHSENGEF